MTNNKMVPVVLRCLAESIMLSWEIASVVIFCVSVLLLNKLPQNVSFCWQCLYCWGLLYLFRLLYYRKTAAYCAARIIVFNTSGIFAFSLFCMWSVGSIKESKNFLDPTTWRQQRPSWTDIVCVYFLCPSYPEVTRITFHRLTDIPWVDEN